MFVCLRPRPPPPGLVDSLHRHAKELEDLRAELASTVSGSAADQQQTEEALADARDKLASHQRQLAQARAAADESQAALETAERELQVARTRVEEADKATSQCQEERDRVTVHAAGASWGRVACSVSSMSTCNARPLAAWELVAIVLLFGKDFRGCTQSEGRCLCFLLRPSQRIPERCDILAARIKTIRFALCVVRSAREHELVAHLTMIGRCGGLLELLSMVTLLTGDGG